MKTFIPALVALLIGGCAVSAADSANSSGSRCTKEAAMGSSIPVMKCRTVEEIDRDKAEARTMGDPLKRGTSGMRGAP